MLRYKPLSLSCCGLLIVLIAVVSIIGCVGGVGSDGIFVSFTIGNTTTTITFGGAGLFVVQSNTRVRNVADVLPFESPPTDTPATGALRLRSSSVTVLPPANAKTGAASQQAPITGTATLRVAVDAPGAVSPCDTGTDLGTFEIRVSNGVVTVVDQDLALSLSSTSLFLDNNLSMCLETEGDFDGTMQIEGLDVTFGPSQDIPPRSGLRGTFELRNLDTQNVHILQPAEDFDTSNQFTPGLFRNAVFTNLSINDLVTFRAGRDGTVLDAATCPRVNQGDFFAIVEWNGLTLRCFQPVSIPDTAEVCCLPALSGYEWYPDPDGNYGPVQSCVEINGELPYQTPDDCVFFGGVPQGAGTSCDTLTCNEEFQACCFETPGLSPSCGELLFDTCRALGGVPQGRFVHCTDFPCEEPRPQDVACCMDDGSCEDMDADTCLNRSGTPQGTDSVCTPTLCPQPPTPASDEACCLPDGSCQDADTVACAFAGGTPGGPNTECAFVECLGACCLPDACCGLKTLADCTSVSGDYQGFAVDCEPGRCPEAYTCYTIINLPASPVSSYRTVQPACSTDSGKLLNEFPGGGSDPTAPALFKDDIMPGRSFPTREAAAAECCIGLTDYTDDPAFMLTAQVGGEQIGLDRIILDECDELGACCTSDGNCTDASKTDCAALDSTGLGPTEFQGPGSRCDAATCGPPPEYVVWYTSNVCCWGAPHINITDRAGFEAEGLRRNWPGGGIDPVAPVTKAELQGGFATVEEARAWLCPQFTSWFAHAWCGSYIQGPNGWNWQGTAGCSFDPPLPQTDSPPDVNGCP